MEQNLSDSERMRISYFQDENNYIGFYLARGPIELRKINKTHTIQLILFWNIGGQYGYTPIHDCVTDTIWHPQLEKIIAAAFYGIYSIDPCNSEIKHISFDENYHAHMCRDITVDGICFLAGMQYSTCGPICLFADISTGEYKVIEVPKPNSETGMIMGAQKAEDGSYFIAQEEAIHKVTPEEVTFYQELTHKKTFMIGSWSGDDLILTWPFDPYEYTTYLAWDGVELELDHVEYAFKTEQHIWLFQRLFHLNQSEASGPKPEFDLVLQAYDRNGELCRTIPLEQKPSSCDALQDGFWLIYPDHTLQLHDQTGNQIKQTKLELDQHLRNIKELLEKEPPSEKTSGFTGFLKKRIKK